LVADTRVFGREIIVTPAATAPPASTAIAPSASGNQFVHFGKITDILD